MLDALPSQIAVLDSDGAIVWVNRAWREFAEQNGCPRDDAYATDNYLHVCQSAQANDPLAASAEEGVRAVLEGEALRFSLEYPCHSPEEERWFVMFVTPMEGGGAVVNHVNITERKWREMAILAMLGERGEGPASLVRAQVRDDAARDAWTAEYHALLEASLGTRVVKTAEPVRARLSVLAAGLGEARATARDVLDIHLAALGRLDKGDRARHAALMEEGRFLLIELLGHLMSYYRARA